MFMKILCFIYLFLIRLRFPSGQSIANVIRKRYGDQTMSKIRKFEKLDFRCKKCKLDITFLEVCVDKDIMPNFISFVRRTVDLVIRTLTTLVRDCYLIKSLIIKKVNWKRTPIVIMYSKGTLIILYCL